MKWLADELGQARDAEVLRVRLLGAVLNDVPPGAAYQYYSYYTPGYEAEDEGPAQLAPTVG